MNFRKYEFLYVIIKKHMEIQKIKKNALLFYKTRGIDLWQSLFNWKISQKYTRWAR